MSEGDKRSVSTDALETLGMIHFKPEARDAIHLAVDPIMAGEILEPGQHIGICAADGMAYGRGSGKITQLLGIVDPFLPRAVVQGENFWFVVYPRQISSLRHVWSHPAFPDAE